MTRSNTPYTEISDLTIKQFQTANKTRKIDVTNNELQISSRSFSFRFQYSLNQLLVIWIIIVITYFEVITICTWIRSKLADRSNCFQSPSLLNTIIYKIKPKYSKIVQVDVVDTQYCHNWWFMLYLFRHKMISVVKLFLKKIFFVENIFRYLMCTENHKYFLYFH